MWHDNLGWICLGKTCSTAQALANCGADITPPGGNLDVVFTGSGDANGWAELSGWGKICAWGDAGNSSWISFNCSNTSACGSGDYGVYVNLNNYTMGAPLSEDLSNRGFAWNGYSIGSEKYGVGSIQFSPDISVAHVVHFATENGDVYASQNIFPKVGLNSAISGDYNSMYLILADGSVTNFTSSEGRIVDYFGVERDYKSPLVSESYIRDDVNFGGILKEDIPGTEEIYYNQLGFLDVGGIEAEEFATVDSSTLTESWSGGDLPADGLVYLRDGNLTIEGLVTARIASGGDTGDSTILVKGDVVIEENIVYESGIVDELSHLPSFAVIVLGDVRIEPNVTELAGNWFVLGDGTACPDDFSEASAGCGRFSTGDSSSNKLVVNGMVMAKQFHFGRTYTDVLNTPAELFSFDGRIIANPPPGFSDFASDFPKYEENVPF